LVGGGTFSFTSTAVHHNPSRPVLAREQRHCANGDKVHTTRTYDHSRPGLPIKSCARRHNSSPYQTPPPPLLEPGFQKPILIGKRRRRTQPPCINKPRASMGMQRPETSRHLSLVVEISLVAVAGDKNSTSITWRLRCDKAKRACYLVAWVLQPASSGPCWMKEGIVWLGIKCLLVARLPGHVYLPFTAELSRSLLSTHTPSRCPTETSRRSLNSPQRKPSMATSVRRMTTAMAKSASSTTTAPSRSYRGASALDTSP
jgi:hypothetical protein